MRGLYNTGTARMNVHLSANYKSRGFCKQGVLCRTPINRPIPLLRNPRLMQAMDDFPTINGPIKPRKSQNVRLQVGSFVLCARHYDLETSVTFHNKVINCVRTPRPTRHTTYAHVC